MCVDKNLCIFYILVHFIFSKHINRFKLHPFTLLSCVVQHLIYRFFWHKRAIRNSIISCKCGPPVGFVLLIPITTLV